MRLGSLARIVEPQATLAPVEPRRPGTARVTIAVVTTLVLLGLSVAYHDGTFWTDDLEAATEPGPYRFKGTVAHFDPAAGEILLRDGDAQRSLRWNITQPAVGRVYVVDAQILEDGMVEALALTPVFLFR